MALPAVTAVDIKNLLARRGIQNVSGRDWNGKCQALVFQVCKHLGSGPQPYNSAKVALGASRIVSSNPFTAPVGAIHYWQLGIYGHVAIGLGGQNVLMASSHVTTRWGINVGTTTVTEYNRRVAGERYVGWSHTNGRNDINLVKPQIGPANTKVRLKTSAEQDGKPGFIYWLLAQKYSNKYFGTRLETDGIPGPATDRAIVRIVAKDINNDGVLPFKTSAVNDGRRGVLYWKLVQAHANKTYKMNLQVDGKPGPQSRIVEARTAAWHLNRATL